MANMFENAVQFYGDEKTLERLDTFFTAMAAKEKEEKRGQFPVFSKAEKGCFFSVRYEDNKLYYETKWSPNLMVLKEVADHFEVGFLYTYVEARLEIYGETTYRDGILNDDCLFPVDLDLFEYNRDKNAWLFEGSQYEFAVEILKLLLERKKSE